MTHNKDEPSLAVPVKIILAVLVVAGFVMILNETTLAIALPAIMQDYAITAETAQWLLTGFMLTMAVVLPITGWMIDRFTTRSIFTLAVISFLIGTILAALAPTFALLLVARVAQATGTAIIMPLLMTVTMTLVPFEKRGTVMGLVGVVMAAAPALGPTVAGFILGFTTWHGIFWVMVPLVGFVWLLGLFKLSNVGEQKTSPFDLLSVALSIIAFGGLVYGLSSVGVMLDGGSSAAFAVVILLAGVIGAFFFVWRQLVLSKNNEALLDLRPFSYKNYTFTIITMIILFGAVIGVFSTLPLFMQGAMLITALATGLAMLPGGLIEGLLSLVAGRLFDRVGPRPLIIPGMGLTTLILFVLVFVDENTSFVTIVVLYIIFSIALAMLFTPLMTTGLGSLPQHLYSHGSAILGTLQQLAAAAGTAVMLSIYSRVSLNSINAGTAEPVAIAQGSQAAFLAGAVLALIAFVFSLFITRTPVSLPARSVK